MGINKKIIFLNILIYLLFFSRLVHSGSFSVNPISVTLDPNKRSEIVRIKNTSEKKSVLQLKCFVWKQDESGKDIYETTEDIIFFPKILTIDKDEEKIVRIGFAKGQNTEAKEKNYRLYVEEIPSPEPMTTSGVRILLKIGVPIFVEPVKIEEKAEIEHFSISDGKIYLKIKNSGNKHILIPRIKFSGFDSKNNLIFNKTLSGWYILPSIIKSYEIDISPEDCKKINKIEYKIEAENFVLDGKLNDIKGACPIK